MLKLLIPAVLAIALTGGSVGAADRDYLSCDLPKQRILEGKMAGPITDQRQAHIAARADVLLADIRTAGQGHRITQTEAEGLSRSVDAVRQDADTFTRQQGFLSAAQRASYDRALDSVAMQLCR